MYLADEFRQAQEAQIETLFGITGKAFEGVEKLVGLNVRTAREMLAESGEATLAALSATDVPTFIDLQSRAVKPVADKAVAYSREVYEIVTQTSAEISRVAEVSAGEVQRRFASAVDAASKQTPTAFQDAVEMLRNSASEAQNAAADTARTAASQTAEATEAAAEPLVVAVDSTAKAARRRAAE